MSEDVIQIAPVQRGHAKIILGLAGTSGDGKTYTALLLALGLAGGDPKKVGLLDTEQNRGSLYSDIFDEPFLHGNLTAPFSPARYALAMRQFADAGIEALVIDSLSAEHEGSGGLEDIAYGTNSKMADWKTAKREHKKMMSVLLYMPCHVVCCFRAREKTDFKNPREPKGMGVQPIAEKNVLFEMSASFLLRQQGQSRDVIKLPECLRPILDHGGYLTTEDGAALREWIGGLDPVERARNILRLAASEGTQQFKEAWSSLSSDDRKAVGEKFKNTLKDQATAADAERLAIKGDNGAPEGEIDENGNYKF